MAQWHLDELQEFMERRGWRIVAHKAGDDYSVSASWIIQRSTQEKTLVIDFEGLDDMKTLPLEQSYGCHIRGRSSIGLYFGKRGHKSSSRRANWHDELSNFATQLDEAEKV